ELSHAQLLHKSSTALSTASKQCPVIPQDHLRGVVAGGAGDAAAGMGAGAAVIEALQRSAIVGMAQHRARREQLVQAQRAMEDVPAEQAEFALEIQRRQDLPAEHALRKTGRIAVDGCYHEVGDP